MKAIVCTKYGSADVLQLKEVEKPTPKEEEVLVKVHAASVNAADLETLRGVFIVRIVGPLKPMYKILGTDIAGRVEAVGRNVKHFLPGDEIWGDLSYPHGYGTFAEYVCIPENALRLKPASMTFEEAAAVPTAAVVALQNLRDKRQIQPGQKVLIYGASGGIGTFAVQIAKSFGAEVTGVCSTRNLDLVRSIGADRVIDYTQEDFTQKGVYYDLIFDAVGKRSFSDCKRALSPKGIYVTTEFSPTLALLGLWISKTGSRKMIPMPPKRPDRHIKELFEELLEAGKLTPIIDRCYALNEVPEAFRYYEKGHTRGRVVIEIY